jgi:hypothetical protein
MMATWGCLMTGIGALTQSQDAKRGLEGTAACEVTRINESTMAGFHSIVSQFKSLTRDFIRYGPIWAEIRRLAEAV